MVGRTAARLSRGWMASGRWSARVELTTALNQDLETGSERVANTYQRDCAQGWGLSLASPHGMLLV